MNKGLNNIVQIIFYEDGDEKARRPMGIGWRQ